MGSSTVNATVYKDAQVARAMERADLLAKTPDVQGREYGWSVFVAGEGDVVRAVFVVPDLDGPMRDASLVYSTEDGKVLE